MENWKIVEGFENKYAVSDLGRVKSYYDNRQKLRSEPLILKPVVIGHKPNNLYYAVNLYLNKKLIQKSVHRLVANAFIDNPELLPLVNHRDENTFNNVWINLEWCSEQYNQEYSLAKRYTFISPEGEEVYVFNLRKFARDNSLNHSHMYQVHLGKLKSYKKWKASRTS